MVLEDLIEIADQEKETRKQICVRCCMSAGCMSSRSAEVKAALEKAVIESQLVDRVAVRRVGCMGLCGPGPLVSVEPPNLLYQHVTPENAPSIIDALAGGTAKAERCDSQHPFFARQTLVVRVNGGRIDPERIEDYIEAGGYRALHHVLSEMQPAQVIDAIIRSGLRGRGGAGYPTGLKWATVAKSGGKQKFVICNGAEPQTYLRELRQRAFRGDGILSGLHASQGSCWRG
jgi:bidirectional [NiFe] hydrogenase diaphorase subunit